MLAEPLPVHEHGKPLGMMFPWQGLKGGLICHNGSFDGPVAFPIEVAEPPGVPTRVIVEKANPTGRGPGGAANPPVRMRLVVERTAQWLGRIRRSGWPQSAAAPSPPPRPHASSPGVALTPALVQACAQSPREAYILGWLLRVVGPAASRQDGRYRVFERGEPLAAVTYERLAAETGLTVQQARTAVAGLSDLGLIERRAAPPGGGRTNCFRVTDKALALAVPDGEIR